MRLRQGGFIAWKLFYIISLKQAAFGDTSMSLNSICVSMTSVYIKKWEIFETAKVWVKFTGSCLAENSTHLSEIIVLINSISWVKLGSNSVSLPFKVSGGHPHKIV